MGFGTRFKGFAPAKAVKVLPNPSAGLETPSPIVSQRLATRGGDGKPRRDERDGIRIFYDLEDAERQSEIEGNDELDIYYCVFALDTAIDVAKRLSREENGTPFWCVYYADPHYWHVACPTAVVG